MSEQTSQMRAGVRAMVTGAGRLRGASHGVLMAILCANALAPVVAASASAGAVVTAGVGALGAVGGNVLTNVVTAAVDSLRRTRPAGDIPLPAAVDELFARIQAGLAADQADADQLRVEIAAVLREIGAAREAIEAAIQTGDEELQRTVVAALGGMATQFSEFGFVLNEVRDTVSRLQLNSLTLEAERRHEGELIRQQATQLRLIREQLSVIERVARTHPAGDTSSETSSGLPRWDQPPYLGLWPFQEGQAEVFYGRERVAAELTGRVEQCLTEVSCVVVTGASGVGKSSLVRAGLLPAIAKGQLAVTGSSDWPRIVITPTAKPLTELATHLAMLVGTDAVSVRTRLEQQPHETYLLARQAVLAHSTGLPSQAQEDVRSHGRLIVVVDQFEELFTLTQSEVEAEHGPHAFITALLSIATAPAGAPTPAGVVVIVLRGDFLDRCAANPALVPVLQNGGFIVGPMAEAELRQAITGPAEAAGLTLDNGLADDILADLRAATTTKEFSVGALPWLSQVMLLTWQNRQDQRLTRRGYLATGGVAHAVQTSAEAVYQALTPAQQHLARDVFVRMTLTARDGHVARRQVSLVELHTYPGSPPDRQGEVEAVLEGFAARRLVVLAEDTVEIAHDTLLQAWPRLRSWLEDDQAGRVLYSQLINDATDWDTHKRDPSFLYRGTRLATVQSARAAWRTDPARYPAVTDAAEQFLQHAHRSHTRATRRRRGTVSILVLMLIAATVAAGFAVEASRQATQQRTIAVSRQLAAQSQTIGTSDPVRAQLLAAAAWRINTNPESRASMYAALVNPALRLFTDTDAVNSVAFNPDGRTIATGSAAGTARLWDVTTGRAIATLTGHTDSVLSVALSPDGRTLATTSIDGTARLWDVTTARALTTLTGHTSYVDSVTFSPDGKSLATGSGDGTARLWDVTTGQAVTTLTGDTDVVASVAFSPDGRTLASGTREGPVRLWEVATGKPITTLTGHTNMVASVAFSPDGRTVATGSDDGTARLWKAATGKPITTFTGHIGSVRSVAFSPDGRTLATGSGSGMGDDGTARLWDVTTRQLLSTLTGHTRSVASVAFSPDGRSLATGSGDGTARLWDLATGQAVTTLTGPNLVRSVAFSPDGRTLATATGDRYFRDINGTAVLWEVATGKPVATLSGHTRPVNAVAFSPDGRTLATGSNDGTARLWDVATGKPVATLPGHTRPVNAVAFSPNGRTLATGSNDGTARLWDVATGRVLTTLTGRTSSVASVAFSPDGRILATGSSDGTARLWDVATGKPVATLPGHTRPVNAVAFSPNGRTLATGSNDGTARLWDVATGRVLTTLTGRTSSVASVAFSPDGRILATGSGIDDNGMAVLWDVATGKPVITFTGHSGDVTSVAFSPDGRTLATGSSERTARLWPTEWIPDPYGLLCSRAGRPLSTQEWKAYIPDLPYEKVCG
ncbi:AAA family ATPase [Micromonospora sp. WMMD712]|uniref:nSTAND1 domain-containing NTPase n=1 Tax=Micromonospora sp. WMMD712 TaxID=3016096 RepID=UPI00249CCD9C|nr:AAA family ATPase [Micromonospora sp. WMMD712]WFE59556.1 hypothetical protein O7633_23080 [Micromonospora sp. WMMD712]